MTVAEGIAGLIASVLTIIAAIIVMGRYMDRRFHKWADSVITNSKIINDLSQRVTSVEGAVHTLETVVRVKMNP